jgi:very-short-patch-repair endonuclease
MAGTEDLAALGKTLNLMDYLAEVTDAAERDPVRDVLSDENGAPEIVRWLADLPAGVTFLPSSNDDVILRVKPPQLRPEPRIPERLRGWTDSDDPRGRTDGLPGLLSAGPRTEEPSLRVPPPATVVAAFQTWLASWRRWAADHDRQREIQKLYSELERAAKLLEQQDDAYEFVVAVGLVCWRTPDGDDIRRHIVTEAATPRLDRVTAEVTVTLGAGRRRMEDKELFGVEECYQPERGRQARQAVLDSDAGIFDPALLRLTRDWMGVGLTVPCELLERRDPVPVSPTMTMTSAPALLLRPRSRVLLAEAYKRIAEALRAPDAQVPVALAQLVVDTERHQRDAWLLAQGASSGDVLGADPLFPLPTNDEQGRVIELLRTETGVVVQGPPGTGKTHTIANLVSALLARGQRVLVTSQKDQALRVLREKIPPELRRLCVLLAGGSKDAAKELEQGLDALSEAQASPGTASLPTQITRLDEERVRLRSKAVELNNRIRDLRDIENVRHESVVPGYPDIEYKGTLTEIVRQVKANTARFDWVPVVDPSLPDRPPLGPRDLAELLGLLRGATSGRRARLGQRIPERGQLPSAGALADIIAVEREARATADGDSGEFVRYLATLGEERLTILGRVRDHVRSVSQRLGIEGPERAPEWIRRALDDRLANRNAGLWGQLIEVRDEAGRLQQSLRMQGVRFVVELPPVHELGLGRANGLLNAGRQLLTHFEQGGKLRKVMKNAAQKEAGELLEIVRVDGRPPAARTQLAAALERLEAEIAAALLVIKWSDAGVPVSHERLTQTLSELDDNGRKLADIDQLAMARAQTAQVLADGGLSIDLSTFTNFRAVLDFVAGALRRLSLDRARNQVGQLGEAVRAWATLPDSCPELAALVTAITDRDVDGYHHGLEAIEVARTEQEQERRLGALYRTLDSVHPRLADLLARTAADPEWDDRVGELPGAWAWSKAQQFVQRWRNADEERRLVAEFDQIEDQVRRTTERLAAAEALHACMARMSDTHARALRGYREHMSHVGAGGGRKAGEFRKAARAAMEKAKDAVPAWVVPLPNLLDNIAAERDSFDVVIVDEASQVGLENLFLLWMAPRVIVVGDDKQCTPGQTRMGKIDELFTRLGEHLGDLDHEIRLHFTSKSNLYGLLSARSGKDAVVRLREHFRCMPEIINWSSGQFYGEEGLPGLVALRERKATDLDPLNVVFVENAETEGRNQQKRNRIEAKRIVDQLLMCLADPRYEGKTFGVIVLQGYGQVKLLDHEIMAALTPEQREDHKIRVGTPPNFQGDERDVIFLSMVVADPPHLQAAQTWQQAYNVAASRAKDQMWLFSSVRPPDLKPGDLRHSLMTYMLAPPSVFGPSPSLESVSATRQCEPFDSLFEQRVYREIKQRGYYAVPQYRVGSRSLDIVVTGAGGRLAVECDGHYWHTGPVQQTSDARRDRELRRMGWDVVRIRESEYEFDAERELSTLWSRLAERGIHPGDHERTLNGLTEWTPVDLPSEDAAHDTGEAFA